MKHSSTENSIYIDEFNYPLSDDRIAKYPLPQRDASRLLVYQEGRIIESRFSRLADFLPGNALLVYNNTRVIQARLLFKKPTGANIEVFCLEPLVPADYALSLGATGECVWKCMVGNLKKWKEGRLKKELSIGERSFIFEAELLATEGNTHSVRFSWNDAEVHFAEILENAGELPIPPYLHRKTEQSDLTTYQTVYSKIKGSVAAPTAGLHFTDEVFESLKPKNIELDEVTLHVGAGTFQPVKVHDVSHHHMHTEVISVHRDTIEHLQKKLGSIIAVGTTSVRTLESLYHLSPALSAGEEINLLNQDSKTLRVTQWQPYEFESKLSAHDALQNILNYLDRNKLTTIHAETQIMIRPGYEFKIVNGMITNFHQPKSTLLLLVSAFVDGNWKPIYDYALSHDFRFLSYGDSSLLLKEKKMKFE